MAEGQSGAPTPEAWIGKRVSVVSLQHSSTGVLIEVNDRGVVLSYARATSRREPSGVVEHVQTTEECFYPWDQVRSIIRLAEEQ